MLAALFVESGSRNRRVERQRELTAEDLWNEVADRLKDALNDTTYRTWFDQVAGGEVSSEGVVLTVPNDFTREWIEAHFLGLVQAAVRELTGDERPVRLLVRADRQPEEVSAPTIRSEAAVPAVARAYEGLNPKYTFDSFVIGSSNRFAHAAALAVAEAPAQAYNPLFIYGG